MSDVPHRACRLTLDLEADTKDDLVNALENIITMIDRGELTRGCSGGWSSGYTYEYTQADNPTGEEYRAMLKDWLGRNRAAHSASTTPGE